MSKKTYRVRNWREYNQSLVKRESITLWFSEETIENWRAPANTCRRGRPKEYADEAILYGLT